MKTFKVFVTHHFTANEIYEVQAEDEGYLDEALKDNSPGELGKRIYTESPVLSYSVITHQEEI